MIIARKSSTELRDLRDRTSLLDTMVGGSRLQITSCAPSSRDMERARVAFLEAAHRRTSSVTGPNPNQASGALLIEWGDSRILLGGDLVSHEDHEHSGWSNAAKSITKPVQVVKVAHHGSEPAHHGELWERMDPVLAIVTPFQQATGSQPPRPDDIERLKSKSFVALTAPPAWHGKRGTPRPGEMRPGPRRGTRRLDRLVPTVCPPGSEDIWNAVGVAMDSSGEIKKIVLSGAAAIY